MDRVNVNDYPFSISILETDGKTYRPIAYFRDWTNLDKLEQFCFDRNRINFGSSVLDKFYATRWNFSTGKWVKIF